MAQIFLSNYDGAWGYKYEFRVTAVERNVNILDNTSIIDAVAQLRRIDISDNGAYNTYGTAWSININGQKFSGTSVWSTKNTNEWQTLGNASKKITHNPDGSKTITISGEHVGNSASGNSKMGNSSGSGSLTLTKIPRASKVSLSTTNFTIGTTVRINTNRVTSSFTHKAKITFNGKTLSDKNNIGSYLDWNTSDLFSLMTDKVESTGTVTLYTYSGSTQIGNPTSINFTANARNQKPTFTNFQYEDTNSTILALTGNNQKIVPRYSNIKVKIPVSMRMIPKNSATGREYQVFTQNNFSFSLKYSSTAEVSGTINNFNSNQLNITAFDSRGNSTNVIKQLSANIIQYKELALTSNFRLERTNFVGNSITISGGGTWKNVNFGSVTNSIKTMTIQIQNPSGSWSQVYDIKNLFNFDTNGTWYNKDDNEFSSFNFVFGTEYNVQIIVKDELSTITINAKVNGGNVLLDGLKGYGVAVGGIFDKAKGVFQVYHDVTELFDIDDSGNINIVGNIIRNNGYAMQYRGEAHNFNDAVTHGFYWVAPPLSHAPVGSGYGSLETIVSNGTTWSASAQESWIWQICRMTTGRTYMRYGVNDETMSGWTFMVNAKVLYDNSSGTTGTVTLSETVGNFEYLEIYYRNISYSMYTSTKIQSPNGKSALLDAAFTFGSESGVRIAASRQVTISGTTISTTGEYGVWDSFSGITGNNNILIVRVVGYR